MMPPRDEVEIQVGFGKHVEMRKVQVPAGDAPPWDARTKFQVVGGDQVRIDGLAKASGRARYAFDVNLPGMLHGVIVRSAVARGKLTALDLEVVRGMPGVVAVVRLKKDGQRVRFVGDELAAIAARTLDQARDALGKVQPVIEAEAHNVHYLQSNEAPVLDGDGNVVDPWPADDKVDAAIGAAAVTLEGTYRTEVQTHSSLETHGNVARWDGDDLELWSSTQATFGVRGTLAQALPEQGCKVGKITVHAEFVGGGFGSKFGPGTEGLAVALLAKEAGAPVKMMLDRFEEHTCTGNRPAALMQVRAGAQKDGAITVWDWRSFGGCGHNAGGGNVVFPLHYVDQKAQRRAHKDIGTDTDPARPMRAPGWPQGYFGAELFVDELAAAVGMDPVAFRQKNDPQVIRREQWLMGIEKFGWQQARERRNEPGARLLRGVGCASARWGGMGNPGRPPHGILCRIHPDGTVESRSGAQDIGTGMKTVMALLTAEELGLEAAQIKVSMGHTDDPSGPASGGSTTTPSLAPAVRHAAFLARQELASAVAQQIGCKPEEVQFKGGKVGVDTRQLTFREACKMIGPNPIEKRGQRFPDYQGGAFNNGVCGCQFAEVEVDSWTGVVRVVRMLAIQDCGLVIAKKLAESQVLGAMIQGISYALHEQRLLDTRSGRMLNGDFLNYKILGTQDMPELDVVMMSVANGHTNTGAVGLGEPPSVAAPAAVANAVYHALGVPVRHLPITPDKVLQALGQRKGG